MQILVWAPNYYADTNNTDLGTARFRMQTGVRTASYCAATYIYMHADLVLAAAFGLDIRIRTWMSPIRLPYFTKESACYKHVRKL